MNMPPNNSVYLSPPHMGGTEQKYIKEAFYSNRVAPSGADVDTFEESLARYCGSKYVVALNSRTDAIHQALIIFGVEQGDGVIVSTFTFSSTINRIFTLVQHQF